MISTGGTGPVGDVPDEAAQMQAWADWFDRNDVSYRALSEALELSKAEVAAERQRLHDLETRIEALAADVERNARAELDRYGQTSGVLAVVDRIRALVSEASASPVSDDTGGTKP